MAYNRGIVQGSMFMNEFMKSYNQGQMLQADISRFKFQQKRYADELSYRDKRNAITDDRYNKTSARNAMNDKLALFGIESELTTGLAQAEARAKTDKRYLPEVENARKQLEGFYNITGKSRPETSSESYMPSTKPEGPWDSVIKQIPGFESHGTEKTTLKSIGETKEGVRSIQTDLETGQPYTMKGNTKYFIDDIDKWGNPTNLRAAEDTDTDDIDLDDEGSLDKMRDRLEDFDIEKVAPGDTAKGTVEKGGRAGVDASITRDLNKIAVRLGGTSFNNISDKGNQRDIVRVYKEKLMAGDENMQDKVKQLVSLYAITGLATTDEIMSDALNLNLNKGRNIAQAAYGGVRRRGMAGLGWIGGQAKDIGHEIADVFTGGTTSKDRDFSTEYAEAGWRQKWTEGQIADMKEGAKKTVDLMMENEETRREILGNAEESEGRLLADSDPRSWNESERLLADAIIERDLDNLLSGYLDYEFSGRRYNRAEKAVGGAIVGTGKWLGRIGGRAVEAAKSIGPTATTVTPKKVSNTADVMSRVDKWSHDNEYHIFQPELWKRHFDK